jgi:hypothetical protein
MREIFAIAVLIFCSGLAAQVSTDSLVGYWPFNENVEDVSGNQNNGTLFGPSLTEDRFGNENSAYYFDGENDFIEIIPVSDVSDVGDFTVALWAYCYDWNIQNPLDEVYDRQYIFEGAASGSNVSSEYYRNGVRIMYDYSISSEEQLHNTIIYDYTDLENNYLATNTSLSLAGSWHFIAFLRENDQDLTFFDGEYINSTYIVNDKRSEHIEMQHPWYIGAILNSNDWDYCFHGKIDDVYFYKRALEKEELQQLYSVASSYPICSLEDENILIYPNPCHHSFSIEKSKNDIVQAEIYTIEGELIEMVYLDDNKRDIDVSDYSQGVYLVRISGDQFIKNYKVVVQ